MATFKKKFEINGVGIHSGAPVRMVVRPRKASGIVFYRVDLDKNFPIDAIYSNVGETRFRNTTIGQLNGPHVKTIEHFMAALHVVGVDSAIVEIDGAEVPILDGSAYEFIEKFLLKKKLL